MSVCLCQSVVSLSLSLSLTLSACVHACVRAFVRVCVCEMLKFEDFWQSQGILRPITYASVVVCMFTGVFLSIHCYLFFLIRDLRHVHRGGLP